MSQEDEVQLSTHITSSEPKEEEPEEEEEEYRQLEKALSSDEPDDDDDDGSEFDDETIPNFVTLLSLESTYSARYSRHALACANTPIHA